MMKVAVTCLAGLLLVCGAVAQPISGAGSSAAAPIYQAWGREYQKATGVALTYEPVGSSAGLARIRNREVGFGASDVVPSEAELTAAGLVAFPVAITGIAPVYNLPKIGDGQVRLSGDVLARIFMGEVTQWNAPELVQLNPGLALPELPIRVVGRGDGSGTTYNFADYLAKVSPSWKEKFGVKNTIAWPPAVLSVKGSDAVVKAVKETPGAVGYVDFGYVRENRLAAAQVRNAEGEFTRPSVAGFRTALAESDWASKGSFSATLTNRPGKGSWPITMGTFALLPQATDKPDVTQRVLKFFAWAFRHGDALVQEGNFVRLPDRVQAAAVRSMASVKDKAGNPIGMAVLQ